MITVTKIVEFEAAHYLPEHKGLCKNLHGHSYKLEIEVGADDGLLTENEMIIDFGDLKKLINKMVEDHFDHKCLNNEFETPTAEAMVHWIYMHLSERLSREYRGIVLVRVRLWETSTSYAEKRRI